MESAKIKELIDKLVGLYGEHLSDIEKNAFRLTLNKITDHAEWEGTIRMRAQAVEALRNACPNNDYGRCKIVFDYCEKGVLCSDTMCGLVKRFQTELDEE